MRNILIAVLIILIILAYSQEARTTVGRVSEDERVISSAEQMKHAAATFVATWRK